MASNKKPRKPYKPKAIHLPMMAERAVYADAPASESRTTNTSRNESRILPEIPFPRWRR